MIVAIASRFTTQAQPSIESGVDASRRVAFPFADFFISGRMIPMMPSIPIELRHPTRLEQVVDPNKIPNLSDQELYDLLHRIRGADQRVPLDNAQEALAYAERVIRATHGDKAFTDQAPYVVEDRGEDWFVRGTTSRLRGVLDPVHVELRKSDATVVDFGMTGFNGLKAPPAPTNP